MLRELQARTRLAALWVSALSCTSGGDVEQMVSLCVYGWGFL